MLQSLWDVFAKTLLISSISEMLIQLSLLWFGRLVSCCNHFGDFCDSAEEGEGGIWPTEQVEKSPAP